MNLDDNNGISFCWNQGQQPLSDLLLLACEWSAGDAGCWTRVVCPWCRELLPLPCDRASDSFPGIGIRVTRLHKSQSFYPHNSFSQILTYSWRFYPPCTSLENLDIFMCLWILVLNDSKCTFAISCVGCIGCRFDYQFVYVLILIAFIK